MGMDLSKAQKNQLDQINDLDEIQQDNLHQTLLFNNREINMA
jgi:hypothetical protein